jgi:HSP20 family protein
MTNLVPRNSFFQDLFDFRRDFDQIFNRMLSGGWPFGEVPATGAAAAFSPAIESYVDKDGKTFHLRASLPGVDPKEVQIHAQGNTLTISGERQQKRSGKDLDVHYEEISYGAFERTLALPVGVDADKLTAEYHNGVLELTAPVAAAALPRRIEVKTVPMSKQIGA